ncbi:response regulator [Bacteriovorax sp. Seq25_V]|uniref:response regulator n=1 Tax=Bacteriovorax sp. Seq25_V TaxID=1201288 RepID=UPI000389F01C|nr:response regulator [Bacteriovorax sp. Seq25_V]EQC46599.1 response regulator receiver domain protein [Bacteriovorax sp. Seq25_V]
MLNILLVDDEVEIVEILKTLVQSEFDCNIKTASSGNEAIALCDETKFDLIISDYSMPDGNGAVLFNYNKKNSNLPFVFVSGGYLEDYHDVVDFFETNALNTYIHKPLDIDDLVTSISRIVDNGNKHLGYCHISDFLLMTYDSTDLDIFLKISDRKFVKIKKEGDSSKDELQRYRQKSSESFYCEKHQLTNFLKGIIGNQVKEMMEKKESSKVVDLCGYSIEVMSSSLEFLELTEQNELLITTTTEAALDYFMRQDTLKPKIEALLKTKGYRISHSITMAKICFAIASKTGLGQEAIIAKLINASLLHDVFIPEEFSHIMFLDVNLNRSGSLKKVKDHTIVATEVLSSYPFISSDTLNIIRDHHEFPSGGGFPRGVNENGLSGLSLVFNLCLNIADFLYYQNLDRDNAHHLMNYLQDRGFNQGHSQKYYLEFVTLMKKAALIG